MQECLAARAWARITATSRGAFTNAPRIWDTQKGADMKSAPSTMATNQLLLDGHLTLVNIVNIAVGDIAKERATKIGRGLIE